MAPGDSVDCRQWIADCIVAGGLPGAPTHPVDEILSIAEYEGVTGLLLRAWATSGPDASCQPALELAKRNLAMRELAGLAETRRALSLLAQAGLPFLVLKGNALAYWLYASPMERPRVDVDLLVEGEREAARVAHFLLETGYRSVDGAMPGRATEFEIALQRQDGGAGAPVIDLHWHLVNHARLASALPFDILSEASVAIPGLHPSAHGLGRMHALVHALLHRVTNFPSGRQDRLIWLYDIHLLVSGLSEGEWQRFLHLCIDRQVATPCLDGLLAAAHTFRGELPTHARRALEVAAADESWNLGAFDAGARDRSHLAALPWAQKLRWLSLKLLPSPQFMRHRYGIRGRLGLARAYLTRLWVGFRRGSGW